MNRIRLLIISMILAGVLFVWFLFWGILIVDALMSEDNTRKSDSKTPEHSTVEAKSTPRIPYASYGRKQYFQLNFNHWTPPFYVLPGDSINLWREGEPVLVEYDDGSIDTLGGPFFDSRPGKNGWDVKNTKLRFKAYKKKVRIAIERVPRR